VLRKQKRVECLLDEEIFKAIQSVSSRYGRSVSSVIREAIVNYLQASEYKEIFFKLKNTTQEVQSAINCLEQYRLPELRAELKEVASQLKSLVKELQKQREALEVVAFWGALTVELLKQRLINTKALTPEQFERFKQAWWRLHSDADKRVNLLLGKPVWRGSFDPTVPPSNEVKK